MSTAETGDMNGNGGTPEDGARAARAVVRVRDTNREVRDAAFARPQEYDESGFPITGQPPSFADRVRRLIFG